MAALALLPAVAHASGLQLATEWSWARDGGRILNGTVVIAAVVWLVIKYGGPIMKQRTEGIAQKFDDLESARSKAELALKDYESKLTSIAAEGERIKEEARDEAELIKAKIIEQAEADSKRIVAKAAEQINLETESAKAELRRQTALSVINLAEELLRKNISPQDQKTILTNYISGMEKAN